VKNITESYNKLNPDAKDESYDEMWIKIAKLTERQEDKQKVTEAYKKLYPDMSDFTFEAVKKLTKIDT
jgi:hypothetical protein